MLSTKEKIISAATTCFFQHGFDTANISMISRFCGISRVTIHKQFTSKENLFYQSAKAYSVKSASNLSDYQTAQGDFWSLTHQLVLKNCTEMFADITSAQIRANLIQAAYLHCEDLIGQKRNNTCKAIEEKLQEAIKQKSVTLDNVNLSASEFANNVESMFFGIMSSNMDNNINNLIEQSISIYKAATAITNT